MQAQAPNSPSRRTKDMPYSYSPKPPSLGTSFPSSALEPYTSMASWDALSTRGRVLHGTAKRQCKRSIKANSRLAAGTLPVPKAYCSPAIRKLTFGLAKLPKPDWRKQSMPWGILPKLVLSVRQVSKRPRDGIGVQLVSYIYFYPTLLPSLLSSLLFPFSGLSSLAYIEID